MGLSRRARRSGVAILAALLGTFAPIAAATAYADTPITLPPAQGSSAQSAIEAYKAGNVSQALTLAKSAADTGSTDGAVLAGHILRTGEAGTIDYVGARKFYQKAAVFNHPDALVALGEMGINEQGGLTKADAVSYLTRASDMGRTDAMRALADLYRTGQGTMENEDKSREYLKKASQSFDVEATKRLGDSLFETDPQAALKHYERAAEAGHVEAAYIAGIMYAENYNIRPDEEKSAYWLHQSAKGGYAAAQADYGLRVYQGYGAPRSEVEAARWFKKAAAGGDSEGQFLYAFTLAKGEGVEQNYEESYYWLLKSGQSAVDDYDQDRKVLRERLEQNVDPAVLARAKARL